LAGAGLGLWWAWRGGELRRSLGLTAGLVLRAASAARYATSWRRGADRPAPPGPTALAMPYGLAILVGVCVADGIVWLCRT
jgi:hypothetical protein